MRGGISLTGSSEHIIPLLSWLHFLRPESEVFRLYRKPLFKGEKVFDTALFQHVCAPCCTLNVIANGAFLNHHTGSFVWYPTDEAN
jgi:hypothetical protein